MASFGDKQFRHALCLTESIVIPFGPVRALTIDVKNKIKNTSIVVILFSSELNFSQVKECSPMSSGGVVFTSRVSFYF